MSYPPYNSYLSNLDSLVFDSPSEVVQTEKDVADELDLWSNAQFTFDVKPGVGIYDEEKAKTNSPTTPSVSQFESASGLDPVTYDTLVNYLDYELPRQQQVKLEQKPIATPAPATPKRIQPRPLAPAPTNIAPVTTSTSPTVIAPAPLAPRQVLMPKPPVIHANILASLLATATSANNTPTVKSPVIQKKALKRTLEQQQEDELSEDGQLPDEDKRRRNTAASARFRVKKKMREQAMEQSVREMTLKSDKLQDRVNNLESEIKFLRSLLLDKADKLV